MPTYLLAITPEPIPDEDYPKAFFRMIGCNPDYKDTAWNGTLTFFKVQVGSLWASMIQMNDETVRDNGTVTVVWTVNPFDPLQDQDHQIYHRYRSEIVKYVDSWAIELGSSRGDGFYYQGDVSWYLKQADTALLTSDFANASRARFRVINGSRSDDQST